MGINPPRATALGGGSGNGIRTSKTVNGIKHTYTVSGSQIRSEEWTENGLDHLILYIYDATGAPIGMQYRNSGYIEDWFDSYLFRKNLQGDVIGVYDESGTLMIRYTYDAWGNCRMSSGTIPTYAALHNPFRYRGYFYDTETGLYYLNSRYYDPETVGNGIHKGVFMMNRSVLTSVLTSVLGGIVLGILLLLVSIQPFIETDILLPSIIFGSIIVAIVILYRNYSFKHAILHTILIFMCCFVAIRLFAVTGIVEFLNTILHVQENEANDRAAGLGMVFFLVILLGESIIINGIQLVRSLIKRKKHEES